MQEGILEKDFQKNCLNLSKYSKMKQDWNKYTIINSEMFDCLMANTMYICSNEKLWTQLNKKKSEIICNFDDFFEYSRNIKEIFFKEPF